MGGRGQGDQVGGADWRTLARRGGYPTPALQLTSDPARDTWFAGYIRSYLERDLQEISSVTALPDLRRLMQAAALRLGQMVNQTELGRDVALPQPTVHRLNLLETSYQEEVDFVVEVDRRLVAIEVKGTERPRVEDSRHLRSFREEYKGHARGAPAPHR